MMMTTGRWPNRAFTIGLLAARCGLGVETIRFYERKGLIDQPKRPAGGVRVYPAATVERLGFVHHAQELGFTLREIGELLALRADPTAECGAVKSRAAEKLAEIEAKLIHLAAVRKSLRQLVDVCPGEGDLEQCSIVAMLAAPALTASRLSHPAPASLPMKSTELHIDGMHCQGCAKTVELLLVAVTGVKSVSASYPGHSARVLHDPAVVTPTALAQAVERAGYTVSVRA